MAGKTVPTKPFVVVEDLARLGPQTSLDPDSALTIGHLAPPHSDRTTAGPTRSWILFVALLLLPLAAGAATIYRIGFRFRASAAITAQPPAPTLTPINPTATTATATTPTGATPVTATPAAGVDVALYKSALVDTILRLSGGRHRSPDPGDGTDLMGISAPTSSTDQSADRIAGWDVTTQPGTSQLHLAIDARTTQAATRLRERVIQHYRARLSRIAARYTQRARDAVDSLTNQHRVITDALEQLRNNAPDDATDDNNDPQLEPLEAFQTIWRRLDEPRQGYLRIRRELDEMMSRRRLLSIAPPNTLTEIDAQQREQAYASDIALQEDRRHLQVQLVQLRRAVLKTTSRASSYLQQFDTACRALTDISTSPQAADWSGPNRAALDRISDAAGQLRTATRSFQTDWGRLIRSLDRASVEPGSPDVLDIFDNLVQRVADYRHDAAKLMPELDATVAGLDGLLDEDHPSHHLVSAQVARQHDKLTRAARGFEHAVAELDNPNNYTLDAALRTARGLLHRIRLTRQAIDDSLENAARSDAAARRQADIKELDERIDTLRRQATLQVDEMLVAQQELRTQSEQIPGYVDSVISTGVTTHRRELLTAEAERLESAIQRAKQDLVSPVDATRIKVVHRSVDRRPINLIHTVAFGLLAWSLVFLLVLAMNRVVVSTRAKRSAATRA